MLEIEELLNERGTTCGNLSGLTVWSAASMRPRGDSGKLAGNQRGVPVL